jgi:rubrerythrin
MKFEELLKTAIRMEEEGYDFYKQAEARTANRTGKAMFSFLAEYEVHHKKLLEKLMNKGAPETCELDIPYPKDKIKSVFADARAHMDTSAPVTADDIDALTFAMGKETESYKMYHEAANDASDPKIKATFARMAIEENQHYEILEQTRYYLKENQIWSIWEEGGPIEGG